MKHLLALCAVITLTACVVVPVPIAVSSPPATAARAATTPVPSTASFTSMLNNFRASQGRGAVQQSAVLTRAAQAHAEDMVARNYFSHRAPNGPNGVTFMQRSAAAGCAIRAGAENIANGQTSESQVFTSWQNSSGHRRNMLGRSYTQYGLGRAGNIWVLKFSSGC